MLNRQMVSMTHNVTLSSPHIDVLIGPDEQMVGGSMVPDVKV